MSERCPPQSEVPLWASASSSSTASWRSLNATSVCLNKAYRQANHMRTAREPCRTTSYNGSLRSVCLVQRCRVLLMESGCACRRWQVACCHKAASPLVSLYVGCSSNCCIQPDVAARENARFSIKVGLASSLYVARFVSSHGSSPKWEGWIQLPFICTN